MQNWEIIPLAYIVGVALAFIYYGTPEPRIERNFWKILGRSLLWPTTLLWNTFKVFVIVVGFLTMLLFRLLTGFPQRNEEKRER